MKNILRFLIPLNNTWSFFFSRLVNYTTYSKPLINNTTNGLTINNYINS